MTNIDKATEIITPWIEKEWGHPEDNAESAASALSDAGLLAPDLPDEWVDAKKLREVIDKLRDDGHYVSENLADELEAILPTPPSPRTLADMAPVERAECEWMQCDHPALEEPGVILQIWANGCYVLSREGVVEMEALNHVAPRPDLPRMQWPGNEPEDDVAAATGGELTTQDVVDECRAVRKERAAAESAAPRPEDVPETTEQDDTPNFDPAYTYSDKDEAVWRYYAPNRVWICQDSWGWYVRADSVPPTRFGPYTRIEKEEAPEPVFDPAYTYTDRDGDEWENIEGRWITDDTHAERVAAREDGRGIPSLRAEFGPYTRIEKEEDMQ